AIAVLRKRQRFACELEITHPGADREDVHLAPGIIDVVLARYREACGREDVGECRAIGRLPPMPDVQRPGGIRGDKLHQHPLAPTEGAFAIRGRACVYGRELARVSLRCEVKVDE